MQFWYPDRVQRGEAEQAPPVDHHHIARPRGVSRRGFLRAIGITATSIVVPTLILPEEPKGTLAWARLLKPGEVNQNRDMLGQAISMEDFRENYIYHTIEGLGVSFLPAEPTDPETRYRILRGDLLQLSKFDAGKLLKPLYRPQTHESQKA